jgi:hypothetical protein
MGGISNFQTKTPLNMPRIVPKLMANNIVTIIGISGIVMLTRDTTMPVNAKLAATDRSIHFVRITII